MKVLLLTRYGRLGSSSRLRFYQYVPFLGQHRIEIKAAPLLSDDYIQDLYLDRKKNANAIVRAYLRRLGHLFNSRRFDLIWLEGEFFPYLPSWGERLLSRLNKPLVIDYDDAIFHRYDGHDRFLVRKLLGKKIDRVMKCADLLIAGNNYLVERALSAGSRNVAYLPTAVDLERYQVRRQQFSKSFFTIGWIGSPVTSKYIQMIKPALLDLCLKNKCRLVLIGAADSELHSLPVEIITWSEETEAANISVFDVGIMPLPDEQWERGKCGYKLIQYMACGLPVIASPIGANKDIVKHGVNGFLAESTEEWITALNLLKDNYELNHKMGQAGRRMVETKYCLQVTAPRLVALLRQAVR